MIILICKWCHDEWTLNDLFKMDVLDLAKHFNEFHNIKHMSLNKMLENLVLTEKQIPKLVAHYE